MQEETGILGRDDRQVSAQGRHHGMRMNEMKNRIKLMLVRGIVLAALVIFAAGAVSVGAYAAPLDEILDYEIGAEVNQDATVTLTYHIEWKPLR